MTNDAIPWVARYCLALYAWATCSVLISWRRQNMGQPRSFGPGLVDSARQCLCGVPSLSPPPPYCLSALIANKQTLCIMLLCYHGQVFDFKRIKYRHVVETNLLQFCRMHSASRATWQYWEVLNVLEVSKRCVGRPLSRITPHVLFNENVTLESVFETI